MSVDIPREKEIVTGETMPPFDMEEESALADLAAARAAAEKAQSAPAPEPKPAEKKKEKLSQKHVEDSAQQVAEEIEKGKAAQQPDYCFPPIDLLKSPARASADGTEEMRENSRRLNETLASFNIDAHIINVTRGPSVTRYEVELDKGVRLNKLTGECRYKCPAPPFWDPP